MRLNPGQHSSMLAMTFSDSVRLQGRSLDAVQLRSFNCALRCEHFLHFFGFGSLPKEATMRAYCLSRLLASSNLLARLRITSVSPSALKYGPYFFSARAISVASICRASLREISACGELGFMPRKNQTRSRRDPSPREHLRRKRLE